MEWRVARQNKFHARFEPFPSRQHENMLATPPSPGGISHGLISSPQRPLNLPYPSPAPSTDPTPLRKDTMIPLSPAVCDDPFFFTPRQLAEHLLLTYPLDYKVSPTQLKHSIILSNDVSGKVFLSAIPRFDELGSILGVETLGARVWLWDEITKMRRTSKGYSDWKKENEVEVKVADKEAEPSPPFVGGAKRGRDTIEKCPTEKGDVEIGINWADLGPRAKRQALSKRWTAVRTAASSTVTSDPAPSQESLGDTLTIDTSSRASTIAISSAPSSAVSCGTSMATITPTEPEMSERGTTTDWDSDFNQDEIPSSLLSRGVEPLKYKGSRLATRALRPRSHNLQSLVRSELVDIIDPEMLDHTEIKVMLYAIRVIREDELYEEFIRAARVTAKEADLPRSTLADKETKTTVEFVHEMAGVYSSWVLSKPYPPKSLNSEDVEVMANFDLFLQFKVQFLNLLIPYEKRRKSSSHYGSNAQYRTPTPPPAPARRGRRPKPRPELGLVTSDLPSPMENTQADRSADSEWSSRQRKWGEAVVKRYRDSYKSRPKSLQKLSKQRVKDLRLTPWGVDYVEHSLTPEGLDAFVNWATSHSQGRTKLDRWKNQNPEAYATFIGRFLKMESQLAGGIARLEELHNEHRDKADGIRGGLVRRGVIDTI